MRLVLVVCVFAAVCLPTGAAILNVNPGFEAPAPGDATPRDSYVGGLINAYYQADVPGWTTTDSTGAIEIWRSGALGYFAYEGQQFAEINAYEAGTLTAYVTPNAGTRIGLRFAHRGRDTGADEDEMQAKVTDLGTNQILHIGTYAASSVAWILHSVTFPGLATGNQLRLELTALSSVGGPSFGNFIDTVAFGNIDIPEPSAYVLVFTGFALMLGRKRSRSCSSSR